jgi:hypothetical protein
LSATAIQFPCLVFGFAFQFPRANHIVHSVLVDGRLIIISIVFVDLIFHVLVTNLGFANLATQSYDDKMISKEMLQEK